MSPLRVLVALVLALTTLAGGLVARRSEPPHEWPMTPTEKLAASGIEGRAAL